MSSRTACDDDVLLTFAELGDIPSRVGFIRGDVRDRSSPCCVVTAFTVPDLAEANLTTFATTTQNLATAFIGNRQLCGRFSGYHGAGSMGVAITFAKQARAISKSTLPKPQPPAPQNMAEALVIYRPTGPIIRALVDGAAGGQVHVDTASGASFDLTF